ncbi:MAG TPA: acetyl-CoA carboxylase biotin carboxyl carrier protein [Candidatus Udaeobacter sp.]|nr:acetyl-CoA carboxylase biotin carboxyl carrier protein [Candidatus Udaeobacter sp.]
MAKFDVDEDLLRKLAKLLTETGLSEIEFESGGHRIRVNRATVGQPMAPQPAPVPASPQPGAPPGPASIPDGALVSPMVGTAYLSAEPGGTPFVKVGDKVKKGQTLLIIEAMKVMNPIPAPDAGVIEAVLINDGQPVEYGEALLVIK